MKSAEIIAVGSELLTPYRMDTNSLWLTEQLNKLGIKASRKTIIGDDIDALKTLLQHAGNRSDYVIVSGGLGPTFDDITRDALASAFDLKLEYHEEIFGWIEDFYRKRGLGRTPSENNRRQAYVPEGGRFYYNEVGTAPGILIKLENCSFALLPGPPAELKFVYSAIAKDMFANLELYEVHTRKFKFVNIPESLAEEKLKDLKLPDSADWSILAAYGQVEAHVHVTSADQAYAETVFHDVEEQIADRIGVHYFGADETTLEEAVGLLLEKNKHTVAVAESCSGGWLAQRFTDVPGSSNYFLMGVVSYSNDAKEDLLGVSHETLLKYGAVSRHTAIAMARGIRRKSGADIAAAITGIAGPAGATEDKPVGTVFIAVIDFEGNEICKRFLFGGNREKIRYQSTQSALDMIRMIYLEADLVSAFIVDEENL